MIFANKVADLPGLVAYWIWLVEQVGLKRTFIELTALLMGKMYLD